MLIKCGHPTTIPRRLVISDDPVAVEATIIIEGFSQIWDHQQGPHLGPGRPWFHPPPSLSSSDSQGGGNSPPFSSESSIMQPESETEEEKGVDSVILRDSLSTLVMSKKGTKLQQIRILTSTQPPSLIFNTPFALLSTVLTHLQLLNKDAQTSNFLLPFEIANSLLLTEESSGTLVTKNSAPDNSFAGDTMFLVEENEHNSPTGFELVPVSPAATTASLIRRSPRLKKKLSGPYIPAVQRAQKVQFREQENQNQKHNKAKLVQVEPDYLKQTEPITIEQAEAVLLNAGIELTAPLKNKLAMAGVLPGI